MFRLLVSSTAVVLLTGATLAADLPVPVEPMEAVVAPQFSWTGFYVGVEGGWGSNDTEASLQFTDPTNFFGPCLAAGCLATNLNYNVDGFLIGGRAGANFQNGRFVFGLEGDADYSDMNGSSSVTTNAGLPFAPVNSTASSDYDFFATVRGRIGGAFGRVLVYGTGGLALAQVTDTFSIDVIGANSDLSGSADDLLFGWTAGGGIDFALTDRIVFGANALYFDIGDQTVTLNPTNFVPPAGVVVNANFDHTGFVARGHVSVKFGGGVP